MKMINFDFADYFSEYGYDIYNENDEIYTNLCKNVSKDTNDIGYSKRKEIIYPDDVDLCSESCTYNSTDLINKRFIFLCNISNNNESLFIENNDKNINDNNSTELFNNIKNFTWTYLEMFLSNFNYKLV